MLELLRAVVTRLTPQPLDPRIERLLRRAVEQIDPRLQSFGNYPHAYRSAITGAAEYAAKLARTLPPSLDLSPQQYAREPLLHALFSDVEAIYSAVRDSSEIKHYCREHGKPQGGELFALMGMRRHEKTVFGREMNGDVVQQDVQQTMVYFDAHILTLPSPDYGQFMQQLELHLFDSLIRSFQQQMQQAQELRHELEAERDLLAARQRCGHSLATEEREKLEAIRHQLGILADNHALTNYSRLLGEFMEQRQHYLRLEREDIPIDMRGVRRESRERLAGTFVFYDLIGRDRRRWTLYPVRLPVDELADAMHCSETPERWLKI